MCHSCPAETERNCLFDCPVYSHIQDKHFALPQSLSPTVADFLSTADPALLVISTSFIGILIFPVPQLTWHRLLLVSPVFHAQRLMLQHC